MVPRTPPRNALLGREVAVAYTILVGLYLLKYVTFQPLQIPAYLVIVAYDTVEVALPMLSPYYPIAFPLFLYLLAVIGAGVTRVVRPHLDEETGGLAVVGGICLVVGVISLVFGAVVGGPLIAPADNPTPLAITLATGLVFLAASWWLFGHPSPRRRVTG